MSKITSSTASLMTNEHPSKIPDRTQKAFKDVGEMTASSNMVTIYVGPDRKCWTVHENLICDRTRFFRSAFRGGFAETTEKSIWLEDDDPEIFKLFVEWLYGSDLRCKEKDMRIPGHARDKNHPFDWYGLEAFGHKIASDEVVEVARDVSESCWLCDPFKRTVKVQEVQFVYEKCPDSSPFRENIEERTLEMYLDPNFGDFEHWARLITCNKTYAEAIGKSLKEHMSLELPFDEPCEIESCSIHLRNDEARKFMGY
ncbi:uncharacterized protein L3040_009541 [Drepanopeziza brunnea f. sp. 'multigermtubi']|uniref:BTB domain-containing protein n=1 Tax=Marssonina brunnea f. sp. multigermtubi (strain MB_m1) TaxID=1072389 RepID=K1XU99_MARBU|nr:uncharacterized protein MBM_05513 [Drepanopeziza brunnea f. sp. 'multigermtubi' MB_m1]EKD16219.1 hypothetical protein MBM_05513 [Drepanopeziza brunnea f. sp. 'multigermtubi' MB_m1]KAJ5032955.1 hypothetical protein L3040_009541 [Drepanopeziza brunnea f. sp. 'multigermtubi']